ncbi:MAG: (2Fe-2S)-binding protein [Rhodospirillales bacterium]|nr:(2Fe-2S)-binding protein [Rhodospirillales bacterium]
MMKPEDNELLVRVGPGTAMGALFRRFWLPVMLSDELSEPDCTPVRVNVLGEKLIAFRDTNGRIGLLDAYCTHRRANLFWGRNEDCGLRCVYHGWKFDVDGNCVDVPNAPDGDRLKQNMSTIAYPTMERGSMIWAYLGPRELMPAPPATEVFEAPASHRVIRKIVARGNYLQFMEGDIDSSHVSFLHSNVDNTPLAGSRVTPFAYQDKTPRWTIKPTDYGLMLAAQRNAGPDNYSWRINQWLLPFATLIAAPKDWPFTTNVRVPIDDENSMQFRIWTHPDRPLTDKEIETSQGGVIFPEMIPGTFETKENASNDYLIDRENQRTRTYTGIKGIPSQDLAVTQDQGGGPIADRSRERLTSSDTAIVFMRKRLLDAVKALQQGIEPPEAQNAAAYRVRPIDTVLPRGVDLESGTAADTMKIVA